MGSSSEWTVDAVTRSLEILRQLQELGGAGVTELATHFDMSKSGIHKHLTTLEKSGFVVQKDKKYKLSYNIVPIAEQIKTNTVVYTVGTPEVDTLAEESGVSAYLVFLEKNTAYCLYTAEGEHAVGTDITVGDTVPFHSTCTGKAILSTVSIERRRELLQGELDRKTQATICTKAGLEEKIQQAKHSEVAYEDEENVYGIRGVAAPIWPPDSNTIGAVGVSGPTSLIDDNRFRTELPKIVTKTKNFIEVKANMTPPPRLR